MSIKRVLRGNPHGKTGWEHLKDWWNDEDDPQVNMRTQLQKQFNPLKLFLGDMIELSDHTQQNSQAYEVESIICFTPKYGGDRVTRYELKDTRPTCALEALESPDGVLYTWYQLDDEFELDRKLLHICKHEDTMEHTTHHGDGSENVARYFKDAEMESSAMIFTPDQVDRVDLYGFYYSDEAEKSFLTIEAWSRAQWMRFYVGENISHRQILSLGSL